MKIKSTHPESQGPFVEIDEHQFDETKHEVYVEPEVAEEPEEPAQAPVDPEPAAPADSEVVEEETAEAAVIPQPWGKK